MCEDFAKGTVLYTQEEETVTVLTILYAEAHRKVYLVQWRKKEFLLRWYDRTEATGEREEQHEALVRRIGKNPDAQLLLWPMAIVTEKGKWKEGQAFGELIERLPADYYEMYDFLRADGDPRQKRFPSLHVMIRAGMNLVAAVRRLHLRGMCFMDLNPTNVAIRPSDGDILLKDWENICVEGEPCTVNGMRGYMAPEIVRSGFQVTPNIQTDQFSLAVVLFRLFYIDHPMEGKIWEKFPLITDAAEDELYCIHPIYNMSSRDNRNRPNETYAPNVMRRMAMLPEILMEGFENTFVNGIENINGRTSENRWLQILSQARDQLVFLDPQGKDDRVVRFDRKETIPRGRLRLTLNKGSHEIALYPLQSIFKDVVSGNREEYAQRIGRVASSKGRLVMQNLSGQTWKVYDPVIKKVADVADSAWFRILPGTQIQFDPVHKVVGKVDQPI